MARPVDSPHINAAGRGDVGAATGFITHIVEAAPRHGPSRSRHDVNHLASLALHMLANARRVEEPSEQLNGKTAGHDRSEYAKCAQGSHLRLRLRFLFGRE